MTESTGLSTIADRQPPLDLVLYEGNRTVMTGSDGAATLRLVEEVMDTMEGLRRRVETLSMQSFELIQLTRVERAQMQEELNRARQEAAEWRHQAKEADLRFREAALQAREAGLAAAEARRRAETAEAEAAGLQLYLRKIGLYLRTRLSDLGR